MNKQQLISAHALSEIRAREQLMGVDTIRAIDNTRCGPIIRPFFPLGTPPRKQRRPAVQA